MLLVDRVRAKANELNRPRLSLKDQIFFAKRLSFFIHAGVPLIEAIGIIKMQTRSKTKSQIFTKIAHDISNGQYLATSLERSGNVFGAFAINIIRVGETSGILRENLSYLADELTKRKDLRSRVISALVYPAFITVATLGVSIMLTVFIFPKILPIFTSLHVPLPLTTRALMWLSIFLTHYGILLFFLLCALVIALLVLRKKVQTVRYHADYLLVTLPFFGNIARSYNLANFSRTLGLMLRSGVPITQAMNVVAETTPNLVYQGEYRALAGALIRGETISTRLAQSRSIFPDVLTHMIGVGEATGSLSNTLLYLAEFYETELNDLTKNLSSSIEPILMLVMGLIVGLIAVSVITPIYEITQHLSPR